MEEPSDFISAPLLPISRPCNRLIGSWWNISVKACGWWEVTNMAWCGFGKLDWNGWTWVLCVLCGLCCTDCGWCGKQDRGYETWGIPKLYESVAVITSPVATLSRSTSFFNASFRAVFYVMSLNKFILHYFHSSVKEKYHLYAQLKLAPMAKKDFLLLHKARLKYDQINVQI